MADLFGRLKLGKTDPGENPNGQVSQTSNGTYINANGADGDDYIYTIAASGPRWNKTEPRGMLQDRLVPRPVTVLSNRRR
jgi:hypothetical protein